MALCAFGAIATMAKQLEIFGPIARAWARQGNDVIDCVFSGYVRGAINAPIMLRLENGLNIIGGKSTRNALSACPIPLPRGIPCVEIGLSPSSVAGYLALRVLGVELAFSLSCAICANVITSVWVTFVWAKFACLFCLLALRADFGGGRKWLLSILDTILARVFVHATFADGVQAAEITARARELRGGLFFFAVNTRPRGNGRLLWSLLRALHCEAIFARLTWGTITSFFGAVSDEVCDRLGLAAQMAGLILGHFVTFANDNSQYVVGARTVRRPSFRELPYALLHYTTGVIS